MAAIGRWKIPYHFIPRATCWANMHYTNQVGGNSLLAMQLPNYFLRLLNMIVWMPFRGYSFVFSYSAFIALT